MTAMWWVTVADWNGLQVYDGPAPAPTELVTLDPDHPERLFHFDLRPLAPVDTERGAQWDLMRAVKARGGEVRTCQTEYDHEAGGRTVTLVAFYAGTTGYPSAAPTPEAERHEWPDGYIHAEPFEEPSDES